MKASTPISKARGNCNEKRSSSCSSSGKLRQPKKEKKIPSGCLKDEKQKGKATDNCPDDNAKDKGGRGVSSQGVKPKSKCTKDEETQSRLSTDTTFTSTNDLEEYSSSSTKRDSLSNIPLHSKSDRLKSKDRKYSDDPIENTKPKKKCTKKSSHLKNKGSSESSSKSSARNSNETSNLKNKRSSESSSKSSARNSNETSNLKNKRSSESSSKSSGRNPNKTKQKKGSKKCKNKDRPKPDKVKFDGEKTKPTLYQNCKNQVNKIFNSKSKKKSEVSKKDNNSENGKGCDPNSKVLSERCKKFLIQRGFSVDSLAPVQKVDPPVFASIPSLIKDKLVSSANISTDISEIESNTHSEYQKDRMSILSSLTIEERNDWALNFDETTQRMWSNVLFTSLVHIFFDPNGEKSPYCVPYKFVNTPIETEILVWGAMCNKGTAPLIVLDGQCNSKLLRRVLTRYTLAFGREKLGNLFYLQLDDYDLMEQDILNKTLQHEKVRRLWWPQNSYDLNPISYLWKEILDLLELKPFEPVDHFEKRFTKDWANISPQLCTRLINSMPDRVSEVKRLKGNLTTF